jgi:glycosyltransferase involved in cell wall biosynthesis
MNVLMVRREFPKLSETFVLNEIISLVEAGIDVRILAERGDHGRYHPAFLKYNLIEKVIYNMDFFDEREQPSLEKLTRALGSEELAKMQMKHYVSERFAPDIISAPHATSANVKLSYYLSKVLGVPFVVTFRADDLFVGLDPATHVIPEALYREVCRKMLKPLLEDVSLIFTTSEFNRKVIRSYLGEQALVVVYYSGIDTDFFLPPKAVPEQESNTILCVSRFEKKKGIEYLIDACGILKERGQSFNLRIVGEGPLEGLYRQRVRANGLESSARILAAVNSLGALEEMQRATVFALPSVITETGSRDVLATSLQEAMACERLVITTDLPGNQELVSHGENGLVVPMRNAEALADALEAGLNRPETRHRLGKAARKTVCAKFSARISDDVLHRTLRQVVSASESGTSPPSRDSSARRPHDNHSGGIAQ